MIAALHFLVILTLAFFYFRRSGLDNPVLFWFSFAWKILMGVALGLLYIYYYSANDTWLFFQDATILARYAEQNFSGYLNFLFTDSGNSEIWNQLVNSQERSVFLIKIISVFSLITQHNYWACAAYFSLISFVASWYLFSVIVENFEESKPAAALAFLLFPSISFWSAGLIKESLALAGLYFIASTFVKVLLKKNIKWAEIIASVICFWVAWNLKYYWAALFGAVMLTSLIVFFSAHKIDSISRHKEVSWLMVFVLLCAGVSLLHPNFYLSRVLSVLVTNHDDFVRISDPDAIIHYNQLHDSWWSILSNSPLALFSGVLRPFVWEASGVTEIIAAFENLVIALLIFSSALRWKRPIMNKMLLLSVLVYVVLLCVFLALSTPNFGTLSRYRVGFLPFLIFIVSNRNPLLVYLTNRFLFLR